PARLLLQRVATASPLRPRLVPPDVRARAREPRTLTQLGDVTRRLARLVRPRRPRQLGRSNNAKRHTRRLNDGKLFPAAPMCFGWVLTRWLMTNPQPVNLQTLYRDVPTTTRRRARQTPRLQRERLPARCRRQRRIAP